MNTCLSGKPASRLRLLLILVILFCISGCMSVANSPGTAPSVVTTLSPIHGCPTATSPPLSLDGIGDPYYPNLGNAGYDVQHYDLEMTVDPTKNTLSATETILIRAIQDLDAFDLDFHGLNVRTLEVDGSSADYQRGGDELKVTLPRHLQSGVGFTVKITYDGTPDPVKSSALPIAQGWYYSPDVTFVFSEPAGAESWYAVNDHPCDKATYTLSVTVPKAYVAAANGLLKQTTDNGTTQTYWFETRDPVASYLMTLDIGDFVEETQVGPEGLPIRNYYPRRMADVASPVFAQTSEMIAFYESILGPYPFETYGVVVVDYDISYTLEAQTLTVSGLNTVRLPSRAQIVVPHELAHQWFGDSVSLASWKDIWLNEGFATYCEMLWFEHVNGKQVMDERVRGTYHGDYGDVSTPPGSPSVNDLFNSSVYMRGALTLHALRLKLGDEVFFRILRTYYERYRNSNASTADFIDVAEELSGKQLGDFFNAWLYEKPLPPIPEMGLR